MKHLAYITEQIEGIGGKIKLSCEDFIVREIPLYPPCGQGTHVYFTVRKTDTTTHQAVNLISQYLGVRPSNIGYAGLKDSRAITTQTMSVEHVDPDNLKKFNHPRIKILDCSLHTNKLKTGHLWGNCFNIKIRDIDPQNFDRAQSILDILCKRGVPNYYGIQRFGARKSTAVLGAHLAAGDNAKFLEVFLGNPIETDGPDVKLARQAFDEGDLHKAVQCWPGAFRAERIVLGELVRSHDPARAVKKVDPKMFRLYISAFQSQIFNDILERRINEIDRIYKGDLAQKSNGACFEVQDASAEQARADAMEIHPTGPIIGSRSKIATGPAGICERQVLEQYGIKEENLSDMKKIGRLKVKGTRRAMRFAIQDAKLISSSDDNGNFFTLEFSAPSGCYATSVLRELMKTNDL